MQCRCSRCGARKTMRHPDHYVRVPKCPRPSCKSQKWRVDKYRMRREVGRGAPRPCRCGEYTGRDGCPMPHRKGSGWCIHNPGITVDDRRERWETGSRTKCL